MSLAEDLRGHNAPPPDLLTGDALRTKLLEDHDALLRRRDELLAAEARIPPIDNEDAARKVSDFIKQLTAAAKAADTARVGTKEPYLEGGRGVDGFFKAITDPLATVKRNAEQKLTAFLRAKEAAERQRREDEARQQREAAEAARQAALKAEQDAQDAASLETAIAADKAADVAQADLVKAEKAADVKPAELSRVRGEYGAVSSLRTSWVFDTIDRETIDLEALRHHLPTDGLEKAVRSFIKAGGRELRGTRIFETTDAVVR